MRNSIKNYQYKLDLGEGADCQDAYQEYLFQYGYEDNNERWVAFTLAWNRLETVQALMEKGGHTLQ